MQKIPGKEISEDLISKLKVKSRPSKTFAAILVGENSISANFVKEKEKIAHELGINFKIYNFPEQIESDLLREEINAIAGDKSVGAVVVQLPLPQHLDKQEVLKDIPKEKDVDVLGSEAISEFYVKEDGVLPPSCGVIDEIVSRYNLDLAKSKVAIVGLGLLVGKPITLYLLHKAKEIILIASKGDVKEIKEADIIISGVGKSKLIGPETVKASATVIDFGYDYSEGKLTGDFDHLDLSKLEHIKYYTPTPGGTGPILVAKLFENFYRLNKI